MSFFSKARCSSVIRTYYYQKVCLNNVVMLKIDFTQSSRFILFMIVLGDVLILFNYKHSNWCVSSCFRIASHHSNFYEPINLIAVEYFIIVNLFYEYFACNQWKVLVNSDHRKHIFCQIPNLHSLLFHFWYTEGWSRMIPITCT